MADWRIVDTWCVADLAPGVQVQVRENREGLWQLWITAAGAFTMRFARVRTLAAAKRAVLEGARSSFPAHAAAIDGLLAQLPEE